MPYNNLVSRSDSQALVDEVTSDLMLKNLENTSAAMSLFTRIPLSTSQTRFPVLAALPIAYFVNGDTGLKQTTEVNWANKYINVEEIAAIVPIPENVLDDTSYDLWGAIRPLLEQAIGRVLDAAIFFGTNKPASWPTAIVTDAIAHSNTRTRTTATQAQGGIAEDFNQLMALLEAEGFNPNGFAGKLAYKAYMRGARDTTGQALADLSAMTVYGVPFRTVMDGQWTAGSGQAELVAGDFSQGILGVRKDFTWKLLDQAVLTDASGAIVYNLPQQDMVAMRVTFRAGFQIANPINYQQSVEASRYPFAVMLAP